MMNSAATVAFGFPTSLGLRTQEKHPVKTQLSNASAHNAPEQELSIQVADIYGVHIDNMDILEPRQGEVGEDFASQTSSPDDKDLALIPKERFYLWTLVVVTALVRYRTRRFCGFDVLLHQQGRRDRFADQVYRGFGLHGSIWTPSLQCVPSRSGSS